MKRQAIFLCSVFCAAAVACHASEKVIFDTDMFSDYDDIGALAVLHKLADEGKCEILATVTSTRDNQSVAMCEVLNTYFGRPDIAVGAPTVPAVSRASRPWYRAAVKKHEKWVRHMNASDAEDAVRVYRRLLAAQPDKMVTVCIVGFLTNFQRLLQSGSDDLSPLKGLELVSRKVKVVTIMGFMFPRGREYNIYCDPRAARYVLENCPAPMVFSGWEFGCDVFSGRKVAEFPSDGDPVRDVFAACLLSREESAKAERFDHDREGLGHNSYDQTAVLAAVLGDCDYFALERGTVTMVGEKGDNVWRPHPNGCHARLVPRMPKRALSVIIDDMMAQGPLLSQHGVLCLTFDVGSQNVWENALPTLAKYNARATFYLSGDLTDERLVTMRRLRAAGHTVGLGTLHGTAAPVPFTGRCSLEWIEREVRPQLNAAKSAGFAVMTLAYPANRSDAESDLVLAMRLGFTKFRTGVTDGCAGSEGVPVSERRAVRALWAIDIASGREHCMKAVKQAAAKNEIVAFRSSADVDPAMLEELLIEAKRLGMKAVSLEDLDR